MHGIGSILAADISGPGATFFSVIPYLGLAAFVVGVWREVIRRRHEALKSPEERDTISDELNRIDRTVPISAGFWLLFCLILGAVSMPGVIRWWNSHIGQRETLEAIGSALGFYTAFAAVFVIARRMGFDANLRKATRKVDLAALLLLMLAALSGVYAAATVRWASNWYADVIGPWFWSLVIFQPDSSMLAQMPLAVKGHVIHVVLALAIIPWSRLVTRLIFPAPRLWGFSAFEKAADKATLPEAGAMAARLSGVSVEKDG